jgi:hypothetical protein
MPPFWHFFSDGRIDGFAVFLMGVLGKVGFWLWFFCGEFVVECVVIVDRRHHVARSLKHATDLSFIFASNVETAKAIPFWEPAHQKLVVAWILYADFPIVSL